MKKVRKVVYNNTADSILLKGFLGKVLFEIEMVGDFVSFEKTFFLRRLTVSIYRAGGAGIKRDKIYDFLISKKAKNELLGMLQPTQTLSDSYQQYYTMKTKW